MLMKILMAILIATYLYGSLKKPLLKGSIALGQLKSSMKLIPFDIEDGSLSLQFFGNRSNLKGHILSNNNRLDLSGDARWTGLEQWQTRLQAKSEKLLLNEPDVGQLHIIPNIVITARPHALNLSGLIEVPWGRIKIKELPETAVLSSSDEVILDNKKN